MTSNPFRDLRTRQGISQYELARRVGCTKHAILRLEQGMFENPLPVVVGYFLSTENVSQGSLYSGYQSFQIATREANARFLGPINDERLADCPATTHPLTWLRAQQRPEMSLTEVAKRLCISQSVVGYFEKRSVHQHTVPEQLITALHDADYTEAETDALSDAYCAYRSALVKARPLTLVK